MAFLTLVLTDISKLPEVQSTLESFSSLKFAYDSPKSEILSLVRQADFIFTNPNKATVFLGPDELASAGMLKAICTASTGRTHIDIDFCKAQGIEVLSLKSELELLEELPSTAELAFALMLIGLRRINESMSAASDGKWDYRELMGSQLKSQKVGIVGMGRLGRMFANYADAFGAKVYFVDPNVAGYKNYTKLASIEKLVETCRVVSLHAHVEAGSGHIVTSEALSSARKDLVLVNTARGELVDENAVIDFVNQNSKSSYLADVFANEHLGLKASKLSGAVEENPRIVLTPHIGGMTEEGQQKAYLHAANMLRDLVRNIYTP